MTSVARLVVVRVGGPPVRVDVTYRNEATAPLVELKQTIKSPSCSCARAWDSPIPSPHCEVLLHPLRQRHPHGAVVGGPEQQRVRLGRGHQLTAPFSDSRCAPRPRQDDCQRRHDRPLSCSKASLKLDEGSFCSISSFCWLLEGSTFQVGLLLACFHHPS